MKVSKHIIPNIQTYKSNSTTVSYDEKTNQFILSESGNRWMTFNYSNQIQIKEIYSHYYYAHGHCICTGLGFGIRENFLLQKPEITKITVLEKNYDVIEYNKIINNKLMKEIEVIHIDANDYKGKCDALLLDHYEFNSVYSNNRQILTNASLISKNINSNVTWFWPLENIIEDVMKQELNLSIKETYDKIIKIYDIKNAPNPEENVLLNFVNFFKGNISNAGIAQW